MWSEIRDKSINKAYLAALRKKTEVKQGALIDGAEAVDIVVAALDSGGVYVREFIDLVRIHQEANLNKDAALILGMAIADWKAERQLTPAALLDGDVLKKVRSTLNRFANMFQSNKHVNPQTGHAYNPGQFRGISELMRDGKIGLFHVRPPSPYGGAYDRVKNLIVLVSPTDLSGPGSWTVHMESVLVHEATHAIQDWSNQASTVGSNEADAFIAQAVYYRYKTGERIRYTGKNKESRLLDKLFKAADAAAKQVLNENKVSEGNWVEVLEAVGRYPLYADRINAPSVARREEGAKLIKWEQKTFAHAQKKAANQH